MIAKSKVETASPYASAGILMRLGAVFFIGLIFSLYSSLALAESCSALEAQLSSARKNKARNADPALLRQLAALQRLERARQCSTKTTGGGLFDPCREVGKKIAAVKLQIDQTSISGGANSSALRARYAALGCDAKKSKTVVERKTDARKASPAKVVDAPPRHRVEQKKPEAKGSKQAEKEVAAARTGRSRETVHAGPKNFRVAGTMLFCVRLADGYYFPAPNSQFVGISYASDALDRCRYICDDENIAVYKIEDMALETEDMTAVVDGTKYSELPNAFAYRDARDFKGCDFNRYQERIAELRARTVTPTNLSAAVIPLPTNRPNIDAEAPDVSPPFPGIDPTTTSDANVPKPKIRVILPTYIMPEKARPESEGISTAGLPHGRWPSPSAILGAMLPRP